MVLEDDFCDVIKKARLGQGLDVPQVARRSGLAAREIPILEQGRRSPEKSEVAALAKVLGLRPGSLAEIALEGWGPTERPSAIGVETVLGNIGGYSVKGYVLYDQGEALFIDTGYNPTAMLKVLDRLKLRLTAVCLTHAHVDHAGGLEQILDRWPVQVYLGEDDLDLLRWQPPHGQLLLIPREGNGRWISVGRLRVECLPTPGHTPGGMCYRVQRDADELCFVGDTLFAGSIGRAHPFSLYPVHLESVRTRVLALPADTLLFPGHGPATTVAEELAHNPFA